MPSVIASVKINAGETQSEPVACNEWALTALQSDKPVSVRILGAIEVGDAPVPLSVQPGPPECNPVDLTQGIVLFSVASIQGVSVMVFEATKPVAEDVVIKVRFRSFPND